MDRSGIVIMMLISLFAGDLGGVQEIVNPYGRSVERVIETGREKGWRRVALTLRYSAITAYEEIETYAEEWYYLYRWARLFATEEGSLTRDWMRALEEAELSHTNMAERYQLNPRPLADRISSGLKRILLGNLEFSRSFFDLVLPYDNLVEVFEILETLYERFPTYFPKYLNLALAIAIIYDVPPPPDWPHHQVPGQILPRRLNDVVEAFDYWVRLNESRQSEYDLARLPAEQLKYLVDTPAAIEQLHWARSTVKEAIEEFSGVYDTVIYRRDQVSNNLYIWEMGDYELKTILKTGGICVDQAYYSAQVGKARGIPTLIFRGAGLDGRHAWFGYLLNRESWKFDAGRYGENQYVTGYAHDPQSWADISDHELQFLGERFRQTHYYRRSVYLSNIAAAYLEINDAEAEVEAAEAALNYEKRNRAAWEALHSAILELSEHPRETEAVLRRAAMAFRRYPDLEAHYLGRVNESLVARGELSRARREKDLLATKNREERSDLSVSQAADLLEQSINNDELLLQLRTYRVILIKMSGSSGIDLFDRIVVPFVSHLLDSGHHREAQRMAVLAEQHFNAREGSMLKNAIDRLVEETEQ